MKRKYLTVVYDVPEDFDVSTLTNHEYMSAVSWCHAIDEKNEALKKLKEVELYQESEHP